MSINRLTNRVMNRRDFLKLSSSAYLAAQSMLLTGCTHKKFYNPDQDIILGGGQFKKHSETHHILAIANLHQKETQLVELDFLPHDILIDPKNKMRLLTFEEDGINAAEIDLNSHIVSKALSTSGDRVFNGHGTFNRSGDLIFCTESNTNNHQGSVTVRDASTLKVLDQFSSYGLKPHQCQLTNNEQTLVVSNTGINNVKNSPATIAYIDVQNKKLQEVVTLSKKTLNTGHFSITKDDSLVVASAPVANHKTGGVSIRHKQQPVVTMTQPEVIINQLTGEALSISIDERHNIAAITHPNANLITFWSIDKAELVKAISVPNPRGISLSLSEKHYIVSYGIETNAILINTKELTADTDSIMQSVYSSGEHIINWSRTLTEIMPGEIYSQALTKEG